MPLSNPRPKTISIAERFPVWQLALPASPGVASPPRQWREQDSFKNYAKDTMLSKWGLGWFLCRQLNRRYKLSCEIKVWKNFQSFNLKLTSRACLEWRGKQRNSLRLWRNRWTHHHTVNYSNLVGGREGRDGRSSNGGQKVGKTLQVLPARFSHTLDTARNRKQLI